MSSKTDRILDEMPTILNLIALALVNVVVVAALTIGWE